MEEEVDRIRKSFPGLTCAGWWTRAHVLRQNCESRQFQSDLIPYDSIV